LTSTAKALFHTENPSRTLS